MYQIVYPGQALKPVEGGFLVPLGHGGKAHFGVANFFVPCPQRLLDKVIREFRIIPSQGEFQIEFVTESLEEARCERCELIPEQWLAFDPGMNNLVTGVSTTGESFILDGLALKSYNHFYNKQKAHYQSILELQEPGRKVSAKLQTLNRNRANFVRDYINKAARYIIDFALERGIKGIAWGVNQEQKNGIKLGKRINQQFVQIPQARLRKRVEQLAFLHGLRFVETEESYTSKTCYLSGQLLPSFGEKPEGWVPMGKRVKRGLYKTFNGMFINADCNGAANILQKVAAKLGFEPSRVSIGALTAPYRVRHQHGKFLPGCPTIEAQSLQG
ncbi:MAG: transposase [Synechococcales cyanobacterium RU_4_20]|nr:transposase [Synechococcales cyanobacterium RU_4_20]